MKVRKPCVRCGRKVHTLEHVTEPRCVPCRKRRGSARKAKDRDRYRRAYLKRSGRWREWRVMPDWTECRTCRGWWMVMGPEGECVGCTLSTQRDNGVSAAA